MQSAGGDRSRLSIAFAGPMALTDGMRGGLRRCEMREAASSSGMALTSILMIA